ncbi:winged helix-turn-helix transcriptional regulator [Streptomyces sp. NPDC058653]|uniref:winged helix-turn-helix transcriptional regulator n=1 Tax=Streptomyces sp. NPDC058653 TaxID=3346576 RepID=UPI003667EEDC
MPERDYRCAVEVTAEVIGGKWTPVVPAHPKENESLRFSRIRRLMPDITEKPLTQRLRARVNRLSRSCPRGAT